MVRIRELLPYSSLPFVGSVCLWAACIMSALASGARAEPAMDVTLANGLRVVVQEDHRSPDVVVQVWYKVGSIDELAGKTGLAHVLEHLMFRGTLNVAPGDFANRITAAGGRINAFTSYHYTAFSEQLPSDKLDLAFRLEADRMRNLTISEAEFSREMQAVLAERKWRIDDNPHALVRERLMAAAFPDWPIGHPVIGWKGDLDALQAADARAWYGRWYAPNAAILVVVGDVDASAVFQQARRYFGLLSPIALPERELRLRAGVGGPRRIVVQPTSSQSSYLAMVYPVPGLQSAQQEYEPFALQVIAALLPTLSSSPPQQLTKSEGPGRPIRVWYDRYRAGTSALMIDGVLGHDETTNELEASIRSKLEMIARGIAEDTLQRVTAQLIKSETDARRSLFDQAKKIGLSEAIGLSQHDHELMFDKFREVQPSWIQAVARRYLTDTALTVAEFRN